MRKEEEKQFLKIIETNKLSILRICHMYSTKYMEPPDLFQEVVYNIWKSYSSFANKSNINTWIYRIALNVCMRFKANTNKKYDKHIKLDSINFNKIPIEEVNESEQLEFKTLSNCISKLKDIEKSIILLHLEELGYAEISEVTGLTENHIAVKMKRIKNKLLECITKNT